MNESLGAVVAALDARRGPCPRCGAAMTAVLYGPCPSCVDELGAKYAGRARDVEAEAYEPKMNVTPNAVALKDD